MKIQVKLLAILMGWLSASLAMATALIYYDPHEHGLISVGSAVVTDTFSDHTRPSWNTVTGRYGITSGDPLSQSLGTVRGADGSYLRVMGKECNNWFPTDCNQSPGVSSYVDLANIAGPASAYSVLVYLDIVAEGAMTGQFDWSILGFPGGPGHTTRLAGRWDGDSLDPYCIAHDRDGLCIEYHAPTLDYASGPQTVGALFWIVGEGGFTQEFFSTERYGFWAIDGFWGIDNLRIDIISYSAAPVVDDPPPPGNVPESATLELLGLGLATIGALRRKSKAMKRHKTTASSHPLAAVVYA